MSEPEVFFSGRVTLYSGDCLEILDTLPENSIDSGVIDPPYHFASIVERFGAPDAAPAKVGATGAFARASTGFMGKQWDGGDIAFRPDTWRKVLRVLKPGAHLVAFGAPKNIGHLQIAIEQAGFETRDCLLELMSLDPMVSAFMRSLAPEQCSAFCRLIEESTFGGMLAWVFGNGFPKSHDISKAIDRAAGAERKVTGRGARHGGGKDIKGGKFHSASDAGADSYCAGMATAPATPQAAQWDGHGTALKPAFEAIVLARKPLSEKTVAANVLKWGTGALNIDACRIEATEAEPNKRRATGENGGADSIFGVGNIKRGATLTQGRFPANVLHDGSDDVVEIFPKTGATPGSYESVHRRTVNVYGGGLTGTFRKGHAGPAGSAARFFYSAKAQDDDRLGTHHPTVKPIDLIRWLARLVTPPGGTLLDCFAGSGTAGEAAFREGMSAVLIEREAEYQAEIRRRMAFVLAGPSARRNEVAKQKASRKDKPDDHGPLFSSED